LIKILVKIGIGIMALAAITMAVAVIYGAYKVDEESNKGEESYFD
jgi:hypothetical protein